MGYDSASMADEILSTETPEYDSGEMAEELLTGGAKAALKTLGANFDPKNTAGPGLRLYLSRGDNLEEKRLRIKKIFHDGEIKIMPESAVLGFDEDTLMWRESEQSQWKLIEPDGFDITDIGEAIAPSAEAIVAETAMAIMTSGGSIPATIGRQALGALTGEIVEQAGQSISGVQAQPPSGIFGEALTEGGFSAIGGFAVSPFVAAKNIATGRGALRVGEEGLSTIQAAKRIDPEIADMLTPALVTDNPAITLTERQSAALLPGLRRRYRLLAEKLNTAVAKRSDQSAILKTVSRVQSGMKRLSDEFIGTIGKKGTAMSKGGAALQKGVEEYSVASRNIVSGLYKAARSIEEPMFDFSPIFNTAGDLLKGAKGIVDPKIKAQIKALRAIQGPIQLSNGRPLSITDQIRNVRTQLYALQHVEPGARPDQLTGQATDLLKSVNRVLDSPTNANKVFREAWAKANKAASERFSTLEKAPIIAAAKSQNPADLVKTYAKPGQVDHLLSIRSTISPKRWNEFVDSFYTDLLSDPSLASKKFSKFDQETLDVLIPRSDQKMWRSVIQGLDRINSVGVDDIAERQITNKNFIDSLIRSADPRKAETLAAAAMKTKGMKDSLRAGILEWAWDGVVTQGKNTLNVNREVLSGRIKELKRSGMWRHLSTSDRKIIADAEVVSRAFGMVADAGTSIQAAEAVSSLKKMQASALMTFVRSEIVAQFYLSSFGRRVLIGSGLPNSNGEIIRLMGGALTQISIPEDISKLENE